MIKSFVDISWRSLANLNKSVRDFIRKTLIKFFLYDNDTESYTINFNGVKFEVNAFNDLKVTGFRFLEVDGELYLFDLKNQQAINQIKIQYFNNQLNNTTLDSAEFMESFSNPLRK